MLFNSKWARRIQTRKATVEDFAVWLGKQDASALYDFTDAGDCAYGQFSGKHLGCMALNKVFPNLSCILSTGRQTYGAAAQRLRTAISGGDWNACL